MDPEKGAGSRASSGSIALEEATAGTLQQDVLNGFKLYITLFSVMIAGFLITLDASVVVTVRGSNPCFLLHDDLQLLCRLSQELQHTSTQSQTSVGMAAHMQ